MVHREEMFHGGRCMGGWCTGGILWRVNFICTVYILIYFYIMYLYLFRKSGTFVVLGAHEQKNYKELERQYIYITNVFVYPGYTIDTFEHDIMLLKVIFLREEESCWQKMPFCNAQYKYPSC